MTALQLPPPACDTFPKLLEHHRQVRPARPAIREKDFGIWQTYSWSRVAAEVRDLAAGLLSLGVQRGDKVAIVGDNRPRLYWTMTAVQAIGAIPVPLYQDAVAEEMAYVLEHAEARFAVVEDQEQVDKLLEIRHRLPKLQTVVYEDPRGMRNYAQPFLHAFSAVQDLGRKLASDHPALFEREIDRGAGSDVAIMLYTSGTTGKPKGVCHTHAGLITAARGGCEFDRLGPGDEVL
ncbi:MAG TPA: AMP-binding protein, partial [Kiloniellaceae bacterium]|nr:AMP-binding protein [Kiloniellaceae bacterium]